jgi:hypothetical protein
MKNHNDWYRPPKHGTSPKAEKLVMDFCRSQAFRAHGDESQARVLYEGMAYAMNRGSEQLRTMAVLLTANNTFDWMRGGGLDESAEFHAAFAQHVALHVVAEDCPAAAIISEIWRTSRPLAPGQRPSQKAERQEAIFISAQGRAAAPINVTLSIALGHVVPPPMIHPEGMEISLGLGRFVKSCAPSAAEREATKALLKRLGAGEDTPRLEIRPQDFADISAYNPDAKPQKW